MGINEALNIILWEQVSHRVLTAANGFSLLLCPLPFALLKAKCLSLKKLNEQNDKATCERSPFAAMLKWHRLDFFLRSDDFFFKFRLVYCQRVVILR